MTDFTDQRGDQWAQWRITDLTDWTDAFAARVAALSIDRRLILSMLHTCGPLDARNVATATRMPLGMVLSMLLDLRHNGFVNNGRAGYWRLSRSGELHAADAGLQDRAEPALMPRHHPSKRNAATAPPEDALPVPATIEGPTQ